MVNGDEIAEVLQSEAGFTIATDKKPIVATYGCTTCIAVGGYDATNKIAFVVHFAVSKEVIACGEMIFQHISKLAKKKFEKPIQIHLRGGIFGKANSERTLEAIKQWMILRKDIPMEIVSQDILDDDILDDDMCFREKSLSIDSRNGTVSEYHPKRNPKHREITTLDILFAVSSMIEPNIRLAYISSNNLS